MFMDDLREYRNECGEKIAKMTVEEKNKYFEKSASELQKKIDEKRKKKHSA